jgi:hypothetical protein
MRFIQGLQLAVLTAVFGLGLFVTPTWAAGDGVVLAVGPEVQAMSSWGGLFAWIDLAILDRVIQALFCCVALKFILDLYRSRTVKPQRLSQPFLRALTTDLVQKRRRRAARRYAPVMRERAK